MRLALPIVLGLALACSGGGETGDPVDSPTPVDDSAPPVDDSGADSATDSGPPDTDDGPSCEGDPWYQVRGGSQSDEAWGVGVLPGGDVVFASHEGNPTLTDGYVRRLDPTGAEAWETIWGASYSEQLFVVTEHDGVVYVGGTQWVSFGLFDTQAVLLALSPDTGELLDSYTWETGGWDEVDGLHVDDDGVFLTGWAQGDSGSWDARVVRLTHALDEVWSTDLDLSEGGMDGANGHLVRLDDTIYLAGHADYGLSTETFLAAVDAQTGSVSWVRLEDDGGTHTEALGLTSDGTRLYGVGEGQVDGDGQVLLWAWELDGTLVWASDWGPTGADLSRSIRVWNDTLLVGANSGGQMHLVEVDPADGSAASLAAWGGAGEEFVHDFVLDGDRIYLAAESTSFGGGDLDAVLIAGCLDPLALPAIE